MHRIQNIENFKNSCAFLSSSTRQCFQYSNIFSQISFKKFIYPASTSTPLSNFSKLVKHFFNFMQLLQIIIFMISIVSASTSINDCIFIIFVQLLYCCPQSQFITLWESDAKQCRYSHIMQKISYSVVAVSYLQIYLRERIVYALQGKFLKEALLRNCMKQLPTLRRSFGWRYYCESREMKIAKGLAIFYIYWTGMLRRSSNLFWLSKNMIANSGLLLSISSREESTWVLELVMIQQAAFSSFVISLRSDEKCFMNFLYVSSSFLGFVTFWLSIQKYRWRLLTVLQILVTPCLLAAKQILSNSSRTSFLQELWLLPRWRIKRVILERRHQKYLLEFLGSLSTLKQTSLVNQRRTSRLAGDFQISAEKHQQAQRVLVAFLRDRLAVENHKANRMGQLESRIIQKIALLLFSYISPKIFSKYSSEILEIP